MDMRCAGTLYEPSLEHDGCGFGLIAHMEGQASHALVHAAIGALSRLTHRGAVGADGKSGDGCGLLMKIPRAYFRAVAEAGGIRLHERYAIGMLFLDRSPLHADFARRRLQFELEQQGFSVAGWRTVPVDPDICGEKALETLPRIEQIFINVDAELDEQTAERRLYIARRRAKKVITANAIAFHAASLSLRVICYKGLVLPHNLPVFYQDLQDERLVSSLCIFHQRFSTNTWPQWHLAQPFRYLAHNGEINTIQGNRNWAQARSYKFETPLIPDMEQIRPWVSMSGSDSYSLDNMLEALLAGGMDIFLAMRLLIPPAWQNDKTLDPELQAFYAYHAMHMEPWDGPAGIVLTDGRYAACVMDRNGLRPARYVITRNRWITLASEAGVTDFDAGDVIAKGRLGPGEMLAVDTSNGEFLTTPLIDEKLKRKNPYRAWLNTHAKYLQPRQDDSGVFAERFPADLRRLYQKLFQVSLEELEQVIRPLAEFGQEAVGSMGDDTPLPVLSREARPLFEYFRQQFAQVTNPPIDPLREKIVMSLETCFGPERNLFAEDPGHAARIVVGSPVLAASEFKQLLSESDSHYRHRRIDLVYDPGVALSDALVHVCDAAVAGVREGRRILILSDRLVSPRRLPLHALLATGAIHHRLIEEGLRCDANIVVETATARNPHDFAVLFGYGATAVYPYLAYECVYEISTASRRNPQTREIVRAEANYRDGINKGLYKILSKMGISTIKSYRGAQLFEAVGLDRDVVQTCFKGTVARIGGTGFDDLDSDQRMLVQHAWDKSSALRHGGWLKYTADGEYHAFNPDVVDALQHAVRTGHYRDYRKYTDIVNGRPPAVLRDLLFLWPDQRPVPLATVEPAENIVARFETGAMSLGALSPEAHETLALAMNSLGARSNSGEGGEDPGRFGTGRMSKIKQIASARFGVTPHYLVNAEVLQIKIAQGAKPGEGGQLAGAKVNELIARLRFTTPGTTLISPPPHHDIYSIEDLAQLIFDLKQVNPDAFVSVKLVSEAGVGTIAAGVAKAYADQITISGYDGGTGASPVTSVKYAGSPWELGLRETHQVLRANDLRRKVRLQVDGGLKTGLDVIKAALLGAESFGFGTTALIAMGCRYLRICHLNSCATGVATQDTRLRQRHFSGDVVQVATFFRLVAQEVREWLALLGARRLEEIVGRTDLLKQLSGETDRQNHLDLTPLLDNGSVASDKPHRCLVTHNAPVDEAPLAKAMLSDMATSIETCAGGEFRYAIRNDNRSIGALVSGAIARRHGNAGMEPAPLKVHLEGTAGQSFGAWNAGGLHLYLAGDANDYVGKGMAGGKIVIAPPPGAGYASDENVIMGNTCLYGATGGYLYAAGCAGERFAVRNSGAVAVVEGAGDHCCEYMTGGVVVVLGTVGHNFAAGMTGGLAFVLDRQLRFAQRYNDELVEPYRMDAEVNDDYTQLLHGLVETFVAETGSKWGERVLQDFGTHLREFWVVKPAGASTETLIGIPGTEPGRLPEQRLA